MNYEPCRYPTYSSYRGFWSSFVRRKENVATEERSEEAAEKSNEQTQDKELLKALEELKQSRDELMVRVLSQ